jgi:FMN-dependent NADH-azoreductase
MKLLHLDSSLLDQHSASRELTAAIVARWRADVPGLEVTYRDLDAEPIAHLGGAELSKSDETAVARSERVLQDFLDAEVVVIGAPMYNYSIPSTLKAWIDRIAVAGRSFRYTPEGPQGLAGGKRLIVASTRGGVHPADSGRDFVEPYLRFVFAFLGIDDIEFVTAEGLNLGAERREAGMRAALASIPTPLPKAA